MILLYGVLVWACWKQLVMILGFVLALCLTPFLARATVGWCLDPGGPDGDIALLGWGLGAVLTPSVLVAILLSGLDGRTQLVLAVPAVTFLAFCSRKAACRLRFHGVI